MANTIKMLLSLSFLVQALLVNFTIQFYVSICLNLKKLLLEACEVIMLTKIAVVIIYVYVYSNHYVVYLKYNFICQLDLTLKKKINTSTITGNILP